MYFLKNIASKPCCSFCSSVKPDEPVHSPAQILGTHNIHYVSIIYITLHVSLVYIQLCYINVLYIKLLYIAQYNLH